ncbi:hypothetical protein PybrP1_000984 [[Pythium] brassicae (nom. inval.)]|nr:hypothetical protein PybrP1_000984 [[Pythium] brassicae (nom. inval.)]
MKEFGVKGLKGECTQARFNKLLDDHRRSNASAQRLSGVAEDYTEREVLLDDLSQLVEDQTQQARESIESQKERRDQALAVGETVWAEAVQRLRQQDREDEERPKKIGKLVHIIDLMWTKTDNEIEQRKAIWEAERSGRREEQERVRQSRLVELERDRQ